MIILGGNSRNNIAWGEKFSIALNAKMHYYLHWKNGGDIDVETEAERVPDSDIVIAKSAGVVVALRAIIEGRIHPKRCFFLGTPVYWAKERGYDVQELIEKSRAHFHFVQQNDDPAISAAELKKIIGKNKLTVIEGNDHKYDEINALKNVIEH